MCISIWILLLGDILLFNSFLLLFTLFISYLFHIPLTVHTHTELFFFFWKTLRFQMHFHIKVCTHLICWEITMLNNPTQFCQLLISTVRSIAVTQNKLVSNLTQRKLHCFNPEPANSTNNNPLITQRGQHPNDYYSNTYLLLFI